MLKSLRTIITIALIILMQSCLVELNYQGTYRSLREELPVIVTKKRVSPFQVEDYPPSMTMEYRSINPKYYGQTGKIRIKDSFFFTSIEVGDTLNVK